VTGEEEEVAVVTVGTGKAMGTGCELYFCAEVEIEWEDWEILGP